jgi:hypothetical protein
MKRIKCELGHLHTACDLCESGIVSLTQIHPPFSMGSTHDIVNICGHCFEKLFPQSRISTLPTGEIPDASPQA